MKKTKLGQNFLFDPVILSRIVDSAGVEKGDTVVEIGPGRGVMTRMLSKRAQRVVAIELDRGLYGGLCAELSDCPNVELFCGDCLKFNYRGLGKFRVVANIPYYITTPIIFTLLDAGDALESMTLTMQKEVADRIRARPDTKDYGVLTLSVAWRAQVESYFVISRGAFRPPPKVDSACITIKTLEVPPVEVSDKDLLFKIIRTAFSHRRKTLVNSIRKLHPDMGELVRLSGIDGKRRPGTLTLAEYARLADELKRAARAD